MTKYLNLKLLRQSLGLSQVQLSTEIGLAQGYISELEKGKKQITDEVISKLYDRYGHDVVDEWMQEPPVVQQTVEREINNFSRHRRCIRPEWQQHPDGSFQQDA